MLCGFVGTVLIRFLGSEGTAIMTTPSSLVLFSILIFGLIFLFRCVKQKKKGFLLLFFYINLYVVFYLFVHLVRLQCFSFFCKGALAFVILGVASGEIIPSSGPSHSTSWTEDSFEIGVLMEPFSDTEMGGTSARSSIPRVAGDEAGPSHQGSVVENASLESSMRNRIARLEQDNSPYLLDKAKGEYWAHIKQELDHASSQREYSQLLECENRDLLIRERKHESFRLFNRVLAQTPALADQAPYNPQEVFDDFLDERREALDRQAKKPVGEKAHGQGVPLENRDREEIAFLEGLFLDLQRRGPAAVITIFQSAAPENAQQN